MSTITREDLITEVNYNLKHCYCSEKTKRLMEIALASLEAKPVSVNDDMAYAFHHAISDSSLGSDEVEEIKAGLRAAFANVTAPPASVSVPDAYTRDERGRMMLNGKPEPRIGYGGGWNACRAAMLQEVK